MSSHHCSLLILFQSLYTYFKMKLTVLATLAAGAAAFAPTAQVSVSLIYLTVILTTNISSMSLIILMHQLSTILTRYVSFNYRSATLPLTPKSPLPSFNTCHASPLMIFLPQEPPPLELPVVLPSVSPLTRRDPFSLLETSALL